MELPTGTLQLSVHLPGQKPTLDTGFCQPREETFHQMRWREVHVRQRVPVRDRQGSPAPLAWSYCPEGALSLPWAVASRGRTWQFLGKVLRDSYHWLISTKMSRTRCPQASCISSLTPLLPRCFLRVVTLPPTNWAHVTWEGLSLKTTAWWTLCVAGIWRVPCQYCEMLPLERDEKNFFEGRGVKGAKDQKATTCLI